jgi:hypothetical protein
LLTAEKINTASAYLVAPVTDIDGIVVESGVAAAAMEPYERMGLSIVRG